MLEDLSNKTTVTPSEQRLVYQALEMVYIGTGVNVPKSISLESIGDNEISLESFKDRVLASVNYIATGLSRWIKRYVDYAQHSFVWFELQSREIKRLQNDLADKKNKTSTASVSDNKYLHYDKNNQVKNFKEYVKHYSETMVFMKEVNHLCAEFLKDDFLMSLRNLISPVTGYDKLYQEMFGNLEDFVLKVKKLGDFKKVNSNSASENYTTGNMLGMAEFEISIPVKKYNNKDIDSLRDVGEYFYAGLHRNEKFDISILSNKVEFTDINLNELNKLCTLSLDVIQAYRELMTSVSRLSLLGVLNINMDKVLGSFTAPGVLRWCLGNYRLMVVCSKVLYHTSSASFNFSRGHIKKFIEVTDKAIQNS